MIRLFVKKMTKKFRFIFTIYDIEIYMSRLGKISKKSILMYAGALTVASIAFMLVTGIMGAGLMFGGAVVSMQNIASTKYIEESKAKGIIKTETWSYDIGKWASAIEESAIPIDDSILEKFPRSDEFKKGFKSIVKHHCDPDRGWWCSSVYEFKVSKFDADAIKNIMRELAIQHNKSKDERSEAVKAYDPEKDTVIDGVIDSALITVKYNDIYINLGVSQSYIMP